MALTIFAIALPWIVHALSPYAWWFWGFAIAVVLFRAFCHSFKLYDDLNQKMKPKLEILDSDPVDSVGGTNRVWQVQVRSICSVPIEQCSVRLISINRDGKQEWGGQTIYLAFQSNKDSDATSRTIKPNTTEYLDVIFFLYGPREFLSAAKVGDEVHAWGFAKSFNSIFSAPGDYEITIQITAKNMQTETRRLKFSSRQEGSELHVIPLD